MWHLNLSIWISDLNVSHSLSEDNTTYTHDATSIRLHWYCWCMYVSIKLSSPDHLLLSNPPRIATFPSQRFLMDLTALPPVLLNPYGRKCFLWKHKDAPTLKVWIKILLDILHLERIQHTLDDRLLKGVGNQWFPIWKGLVVKMHCAYLVYISLK